MNEIEATEDAISKIIELSELLAPSNPEMSQHMVQLVETMTNWYATKENLFKFNSLCHPKALGDNIVQSCDFNEWNEMVSELHSKCATAFNKLERLSESERETFNKFINDRPSGWTAKSAASQRRGPL